MFHQGAMIEVRMGICKCKNVFVTWILITRILLAIYIHERENEDICMIEHVLNVGNLYQKEFWNSTSV